MAVNYGRNADMTVVERIKEIAKKRGWNLKTTAIKAGLGENTIYGWKNFTPASDKLQAVADVLNVSVDYLLGNTDSPSPIPAADKVPDWATETDVSKWVEFIDNDRQNELNYGGVPLTEEERQQLNVALATIFWKHRKRDNEQGR
jgi:transcriptional regulator with XRE-family HTH domain